MRGAGNAYRNGGAMASRRSTPPPPVYVFPQHPDDPTLGGAITEEMWEALHRAPTAVPPPSSEATE